ncbi:transposase [Roseobacter litoralis]|uniref:transposase n=1 Tax=Roseobacter litoralis TaxID=42443 RepID=UPI0009FE345F
MIEPFCRRTSKHAGQTGRDSRLCIEAALWIVHTGAKGRELPKEFGKWNSILKRFRRWVKADAFYRMFRALSSGVNFEYATIDGSIVKVHRSGQGEKEGSQPGHRTFAWWDHNQDTCPHRRLGKSHQFLPDAWSGT